MNKKKLAKLFTKIGIIASFVALNMILIPQNIYAGDDDLQVDGFYILPELEEKEVTTINEKISEIGQSGGKVWAKYNEIASSGNLTTAQQITSGIMNRDTIMNYLVLIVKFLSQLGLVIGFLFIMYGGYKYMLSVFEGGKTPSSTITNAIIGVVIVIFSYAIMKILTSVIGIS